MLKSLLNEVRNIRAIIKLLLETLENNSRFEQPVPLPPDELVNVNIAADIMKVSTKTIRRRVEAGIIDDAKILGLVYYSRNQLTAVAQSLKSRR